MKVRAVRLDIAKLRAGQALVPVAILLTIGARHFSHLSLIWAAIVAQGAALAMFLLATRRLGSQDLTVRKGRILVGERMGEILASQVRAWTMDGRVASLYSTHVTWKLNPLDAREQDLQNALAGVLGHAALLRPRGTKQARLTAAIVSILGVVLVCAGFLWNVVALAALGTVTAILGFAVFGALRQKVLVPKKTEGRALETNDR